jgi:hypothetical protein
MDWMLTVLTLLALWTGLGWIAAEYRWSESVFLCGPLVWVSSMISFIGVMLGMCLFWLINKVLELSIKDENE